VGKRLEKMMDIDYAFQEFDALPAGYSIPEGRTKLYGTGHAILCTKDLVDTPALEAAIRHMTAEGKYNF